MNKELFTRFINNECIPEEIDRVVNWLQNEAGTIDGKAILRQIWNDFPQSGIPHTIDYERILDRIHHDISLSRSDKRKYISTVDISRQRVKWRFISVLTKIAALFFIPLLLYFMCTYIIADRPVLSEIVEPVPVNIEVKSPLGSKTYLELPDGSQVWLNYGSCLKFPQKFTGQTRTVELHGECYFEIACNEQKPFIVETGEIQVLVKGTEFNLMAYPEDAVIETTLKRGKVMLQRKVCDGSIQRIFEMEPNHHAIYFKKEKELTYSIENPDKYISWKDGILIFRDDPIDDIVKKLSRWYNVDIRLEDKELSKYTYTATFVDETLPQILELLKIATPIKYTISSRIKQDDGSFSKRIITISLNETHKR
ncbi:MAG: FecR family protein [Bacteroidales bacterium]|nr:FecR family protein [Bacteroidales bacterium]